MRKPYRSIALGPTDIPLFSFRVREIEGGPSRLNTRVRCDVRVSLLVRRPSLLEMTALLKKHVSLHSHSPSPSWSSARVPRRYHTWCPPPGRRMGVGRGGASPCLLYLGETSKDEEDPIPHGGRRTTGGGAGAANGGRDVKGVPVAVRCTRLELGQFELRNFSDSPHACSMPHREGHFSSLGMGLFLDRRTFRHIHGW